MIFLDCGGEYSGTNEVHQYQGVIRLPNLKENLESDPYCSWKIRLPDGLDIALNFTSFDLNGEALEIRYISQVKSNYPFVIYVFRHILPKV